MPCRRLLAERPLPQLQSLKLEGPSPGFDVDVEVDDVVNGGEWDMDPDVDEDLLFEEFGGNVQAYFADEYAAKVADAEEDVLKNAKNRPAAPAALLPALGALGGLQARGRGVEGGRGSSAGCMSGRSA